MKKFSKSNFVKVIGATTLATLIATAGVFAFAPMTANAKVININQEEITESTGLITPRADDPVLFTTESGIKIKFTNNIALGGGTEESSEASTSGITGLPYFQTLAGSTPYTWLIIGKSTTFDLSSQVDLYYNFSQIQKLTETISAYGDFFTGVYEDSSPAGSAIKGNTITNDILARGKSFTASIWENVPSNAELLNNCVLVLASSYLGGSCKVSGIDLNLDSSGSHRDYFCKWKNSPIYNTFQSYLSNNQYGLGQIAHLIQNTTLVTKVHKAEATCNFTIGTETSVSKLFLLGGTTDCSFYWADYLSGTQFKLSENQWLRGTDSSNASSLSNGYHTGFGLYLTSSGTQKKIELNIQSNFTVCTRPSFVISLA